MFSVILSGLRIGHLFWHTLLAHIFSETFFDILFDILSDICSLSFYLAFVSDIHSGIMPCYRDLASSPPTVRVRQAPAISGSCPARPRDPARNIGAGAPPQNWQAHHRGFGSCAPQTASELAIEWLCSRSWQTRWRHAWQEGIWHRCAVVCMLC